MPFTLVDLCAATAAPATSDHQSNASITDDMPMYKVYD